MLPAKNKESKERNLFTNQKKRHKMITTGKEKMISKFARK